MNEDLENEHTELLQFLYASPIGLIEIDLRGTIRLINPCAMNLLLPLARKPVVENLFDVLGGYAPELRNLATAYLPPQGVICDSRRIFVAPSGSDSSAIAKVLACTLVKTSPAHFIATLTDISQQVDQERRLKEAEMWFASLIDSINDFAIVSLDQVGKIDSVNASFVRQTGYSESDLIGRTLDILVNQEIESGFLEMVDQVDLARRDGWHLNEGWQNRKDGSRYWCQKLIAVKSETEAAGNRDIAAYTVIFRDVTRQNADTRKLLQLLRTDQLTGICNRTHFFEIAEREFSRASKDSKHLSLIALDIDHFKTVNDTFGHEAGDEVLRNFAATCISLVRSSDTFARIGGEEFAVLLPKTDLSSAAELARRLCRGIAAASIPIQGQQLRITASLGCAEQNSEVRTLTELMSVADRALYEAKRAGRNQVALATDNQHRRNK